MANFRILPLALAMIGIGAGQLFAANVQEANFKSPITAQPFSALILIPPGKNDDTAMSTDMGSDDDTCHHASGISEYEYTIVTCPYSYFSALSDEYDQRTGAAMKSPRISRIG